MPKKNRGIPSTILTNGAALLPPRNAVTKPQHQRLGFYQYRPLVSGLYWKQGYHKKLTYLCLWGACGRPGFLLQLPWIPTPFTSPLQQCQRKSRGESELWPSPSSHRATPAAVPWKMHRGPVSYLALMMRLSTLSVNRNQVGNFEMTKF